MRRNSDVVRLPREYAGRSGRAAIAAGALIFVGAAGDIIVSAQTPSGTITSRPLFALYVGALIAGFGCLIVALRSLKAMHRTSEEPLPRSGRIGTGVSVAGAGLIAASGVGTLATGLAAGTPAGGWFALFGLGMLLIIGGHLALAAGLRKAGVLRSWWRLPMLAALAALVAVGVPLDPWHDLGLLFFEIAWAAFGVHLVGRARQAAPAVGTSNARRVSSAR